MLQLPVIFVDAFATGPFTGNPAAVVVQPQFPSDDIMLKIADQNQYAETAFLVSREDGSWDLRWFSPTEEVDLCGHATLAAAHVLSHHQAIKNPTLEFHTRSGVLSVAVLGDHNYELNFPAWEPVPVEDSQVIQAISAAIGMNPLECWQVERDFIVVLPGPDAVIDLKPDADLMKQLPKKGICVTAPAQSEGIDFVSRFFAPSLGILEDFVTGSAHCALIPLWAGIMGRDQLVGFQASRRGGRLVCELRGNRVAIAGRCRTYLEGMLRAED